MTGILLAERVFTRHPILTGIYDTFRMPRGSSYVLNSSIDMILSKNNRYFYNITGCRHKINVRNSRKNFSFLVFINKKIRNVVFSLCVIHLNLTAYGRLQKAADIYHHRLPLPCATVISPYNVPCPSAATHHSHPRKRYQYTYLLPCVPGQDRSNTNCLPPDTTPLP